MKSFLLSYTLLPDCKGFNSPCSDGARISTSCSCFRSDAVCQAGECVKEKKLHMRMAPNFFIFCCFPPTCAIRARPNQRESKIFASKRSPTLKMMPHHSEDLSREFGPNADPQVAFKGNCEYRPPLIGKLAISQSSLSREGVPVRASCQSLSRVTERAYPVDVSQANSAFAGLLAAHTLRRSWYSWNTTECSLALPVEHRGPVDAFPGFPVVGGPP